MHDTNLRLATMQKSRINMIDVAKAAGVDRSTVSRALRGDRRIPDTTRDRINEMARQMNYLPNHLARSLSGGRSQILGIMLPDLRNQFYMPHLEEIQEVAEREHFGISVKFCDWDPTREARGLMQFCENRVDGLIWSPIVEDEGDATAIVDKVRAAGVKIVQFGGSHPSLPIYRVWCRERHAVKAGVDYLRALGHRRVGIAVASEVTTLRARLQRDRRDFARTYFEEAGVHIADGDIFTTGDNLYGGMQIAERIASRAPADRPTAIFAADDMLAGALIAGLLFMKVRVPQDVSVLGFDDAPGDAEAPVAITSVSLESRNVGRRAIEILFDLIHDSPQLPADYSINLKPRIVERASCARVAQ